MRPEDVLYLLENSDRKLSECDLQTFFSGNSYKLSLLDLLVAATNYRCMHKIAAFLYGYAIQPLWTFGGCVMKSVALKMFVCK